MPVSSMKGLFAAVVTPTHADGRVDEATFDRLLEFLLSAGVARHLRRRRHRRVSALSGSRAGRADPAGRAADAPQPGAARRHRRRSMRRVIKLGQVAIEEGSEALLLPAPMFFRYEQEDLRAYLHPGQPRARRALPAVRPPGFHQRVRAGDRAGAAARGAVHRRHQGQQRPPGEHREVRRRAAWRRRGRCSSATIGCSRAGCRPAGTAASPAWPASAPNCWPGSTRARSPAATERDRPPARAARGADRAHRGVSDAVGHPDRPGGPRHRHRPAAAATHAPSPAADRGVQRVVPRLARAAVDSLAAPSFQGPDSQPRRRLTASRTGSWQLGAG